MELTRNRTIKGVELTRSRAVRAVVLVLTVLAGVTVVPGETPIVLLGLLFAFGLWNATLLLVRWSRFAGGVAMILLSFVILAIGFIATWVGVVGLLILAHGTWLAIVGASRIRA